MASFNSPVQNAQGTQNELPVLIIGAGLAGLTVALHMVESQPVILMAKRGLGEAATAWAQGGIVGVVDKEHDSIDAHVADTLNAGAGLVVESTARYIAEESAQAIEWLVEQGVPFTEDKSGPMGLHLTREGGHSHRRIAHAADATGRAAVAEPGAGGQPDGAGDGRGAGTVDHEPDLVDLLTDQLQGVDEAGKPYTKIYDTTPGRAMLGQLLPKNGKITFDVVNKMMTKKKMIAMMKNRWVV